jgi:hypothetical protein
LEFVGENTNKGGKANAILPFVNSGYVLCKLRNVVDFLVWSLLVKTLTKAKYQQGGKAKISCGLFVYNSAYKKFSIYTVKQIPFYLIINYRN